MHLKKTMKYIGNKTQIPNYFYVSMGRFNVNFAV